MLCLHGITGTPFEVRPFAEAFGRAGYSVEAPMLAGHGATLARHATAPISAGGTRLRPLLVFLAAG